MDLRTIIDEIAGRADAFLAGAANRGEARAGIAELLIADSPQLKSADRKQVTDAVMAILEDGGFFGSVGSGHGKDADDDADGE